MCNYALGLRAVERSKNVERKDRSKSLDGRRRPVDGELLINCINRQRFCIISGSMCAMFCLLSVGCVCVCVCAKEMKPIWRPCSARADKPQEARSRTTHGQRRDVSDLVNGHGINRVVIGGCGACECCQFVDDTSKPGQVLACFRFRLRSVHRMDCEEISGLHVAIYRPHFESQGPIAARPPRRSRWYQTREKSSLVARNRSHEWTTNVESGSQSASALWCATWSHALAAP